jgi:hypothetical protein
MNYFLSLNKKTQIDSMYTKKEIPSQAKVYFQNNFFPIKLRKTEMRHTVQRQQ